MPGRDTQREALGLHLGEGWRSDRLARAMEEELLQQQWHLKGRVTSEDVGAAGIEVSPVGGSELLGQGFQQPVGKWRAVEVF